MRVAVISPHLDDAVFSVAEHMLSRPDWQFEIVCPFAGVPDDDAGRAKYETLLAEHQAVIDATGWSKRNGPFLDDVYGAAAHDVVDWLNDVLPGQFSEWWAPVGIHHPDHKIIRQIIGHMGRPTEGLSWYEELPYRVLYPAEFGMHSRELVGYDPSMLERKKELCRMYASQIGPDIERCLYVPERLWGAW